MGFVGFMAAFLQQELQQQYKKIRKHRVVQKNYKKRKCRARLVRALFFKDLNNTMRLHTWARVHVCTYEIRIFYEIIKNIHLTKWIYMILY